jgi:hypothetical protein
MSDTDIRIAADAALTTAVAEAGGVTPALSARLPGLQRELLAEALKTPAKPIIELAREAVARAMANG